MDHHPTNSPSSFPAKHTCPSFMSGQAGEAAQKGKALHELFEKKIKGDVATDFEFSEYEVSGIDWAVDVVNISVDAQHPINTEMKVSYGDHYFGTADVVNQHRLFDLKTGEERPYYMQMAAYALAIMDTDITIDEVECHILYSKYRKHQVYTIGRDQAKSLIDNLLIMSNQPNPPKNPSEYCGWCKHILNCDAVYKTAENLTLGKDEDKTLSGDINEEEAEKLSALIPVAKAMEKWAKEVMNRAKDFEEIPNYSWREQSGQRYVTDVSQAYHLLDMATGEGSIERFLECCSLSISKLEDVYGKAIVDLLPIDKKPNTKRLIQQK